MDAESSSSARVLQLVRQAQVVDELLLASQRIGAKATEAVELFVRNELERLHGRETSITACESLLCVTVLEASLTESHPSIAGCRLSARASMPGREEGPVATALRRLVFGMPASDETFARIMCTQTYEQAGIALRACVLALEDAVRPHNCLRILAWANETGNQRLLARASAVALLHFKQAALQDLTGLRMLPKEALGALLSHDCIQASEDDIFTALGVWVAAAKWDRLEHLYDLTVQCVRMRNMGMKDLAHMDSHPLLSECPRTLKLVALAYLASCFSCGDSKEYAEIVGKDRRQRIVVNPAALSFLRQDGVDVAGSERALLQHSNLFRLSPAPKGKPDEALPAAHATLHQLCKGPCGGSGSTPPAASSAEGLTYAVRKLLSTQRKLQCSGGSSSSPGQHDHAEPMDLSTAPQEEAFQQLHGSSMVASTEFFEEQDSARCSSAVAVLPPQHELNSTSSHVSDDYGFSRLLKPLQDRFSHSTGIAAESPICSAAEYAAASEGALGGAQGEGDFMEFDVFNTSPSSSQRSRHTETQQGEAQGEACRQILNTRKLPPGIGLRRQLF